MHPSSFAGSDSCGSKLSTTFVTPHVRFAKELAELMKKYQYEMDAEFFVAILEKAKLTKLEECSY